MKKFKHIGDSEWSVAGKNISHKPVYRCNFCGKFNSIEQIVAKYQGREKYWCYHCDAQIGKQ